VKKIGKKTEASPSKPQGSSLQGARQLIAYVEDDDDNWLVAKLHVAERYELVRASTALQACRLFTDMGSRLTAVLMDIELRGSELDGVELTMLLRGRLMRSSLPEYTKSVPKLDVPVIFVTAHGADAGNYRLTQAGANATIHKPVMFNALNLAIADVHLKRTLERKLVPPRAR